MLMKESRVSKACNRGASRARRGLAEATPRTQNVLAQGQSEAHGDSKLYNTIAEVPARLNLKYRSCNCRASQEFYTAAGAKGRPQGKPRGLKVMEIAAKQEVCRMKRNWRQASMQVSNSSIARPWKLEQNTSGQASRQASRASRLWKLEQNNMTQRRCPFSGPQNVRKSRRAKMSLPNSRFQSQLLQISINLK